MLRFLRFSKLKALKLEALKRRVPRFRPKTLVAVLSASALVFFACAGVLVFRLLIQPRQADGEMAAARSLYYLPAGQPAPQAQGGSASSEAPPLLTFSKLQAINPDVTGWIALPGTAIDYPVLSAPADSPDYYLTHDWERNETKYGSIYMLHPKTSAQKNTILYGHSMKDGRMFDVLLSYEKLDYYRSHPVIQFQKGGDKAVWKIFAVIKANTDPSQGQPFDYQKTSFASTQDFLEYLYQVQVRSLFTLPVDLKSTDEILTLSTCSYEFDGFRTVVLARKVRSGEDAVVDTAKAAKNSQALYPDCWYQRYGGTKPALLSFQDALKSNGLT